MKEIILSPSVNVKKIKFDLIASNAFIRLDHVQATGLRAINDINNLMISVQNTAPMRTADASIPIDIKISPNQTQAVVPLHKKIKRTYAGDDLLNNVIITLDASKIEHFETIQLRYELQGAYEMEALTEIPDDFLRAIYLGIRDGINKLEDLTPERQEIFKKSRYLKLYNELKKK